MATIFTAQNPKLLDTKPELVNVTVAAAQTWSRGSLVIITAGAATLCADGDIPTHIAASDIAAPDTSTLVPLYRLKVGSRLECYTASNTSTAAAVGVANVGNAYDWALITGSAASAIFHLNLGSNSDKCALVIDLAANYEPERNATADSPGKCIVEVLRVI